MATLRAVARAALVFLLVGCGSTEDTDGSAGAGPGGASGAGGSAPSVTAAQACSDEATAACAKYQACTGDFLVSYVFGDMATCVATREGYCTAGLGAPSSASTPATKEACAEDTPNESCTDFIDLTDSATCFTPAGTLGDGAACGTSSQCTSAWCAVASTAVCGVCAPKPKAGDACDASGLCPSGLTCNTNTRKCQAPVQVGGACSTEAVCDTFLGCDDGGTGSGSGTCKALPATLGAACDPNLGCDVLRGFLCYPPANTCGAIAFAGPGEPCGAVSATSYALCKSSAICNNGSNPSGTCVASVGVGETCDVAFGPTCTPGLTCVTDGSSNTGACQRFDPASCQ
jgi:hypothetical protein